MAPITEIIWVACGTEFVSEKDIIALTVRDIYEFKP